MFRHLHLLWPLVLIPLLVGQPLRLYPVDDSPRDPAFQAYLDRLRKAVHDTRCSRSLTI